MDSPVRDKSVRRDLKRRTAAALGMAEVESWFPLL
jgi:hypothetical protein